MGEVLPKLLQHWCLSTNAVTKGSAVRLRETTNSQIVQKFIAARVALPLGQGGLCPRLVDAATNSPCCLQVSLPEPRWSGRVMRV